MNVRSLAVVLALVALALGQATLASANQPPIARASVSPLEARLFEPVLFVDESEDPDGSVVRSVWTFSDGRDVEGRVVTRAFGYAGVHTIELRVYDDAGAGSMLSIPVLVRAPIVHGRAIALATPAASVADTGDVATTHQSSVSRTVGEARHGQLRAAGLDAEVTTLHDPPRAIARATVGLVHIPVPIGYVRASGVEAYVVHGCGWPTMLSATFQQLRLNDNPIVPPGEVAPNTRVDLPGGGALVLNAQEALSPGVVALTALRVLVPGQAPIDVARAVAGASHCPYVG